MKKSNLLVGGALLLTALFTTSCDEVMSKLDNPVSSYLSVGSADVTVPTGDTYQIKAETINSDNPITYKSSDETVATVDANGLVTGVADGEATITVAVAASQYYQEGTKEIKVAVKRPLTFEALEDGTIWVNFTNGVTLEKPIYYSINGGEKVAFTAEVGVPLTKGQKVEFESANDHVSAGSWSRGLRFWPVMKCAVYGNVMSLISPDGNYHTNKEITVPGALYGLFSGDAGWYLDDNYNWHYAEYPNSNILSHDTYKLELPATTLASTSYAQMFRLCSGLKKAPELPATTLADDCYYTMFQKCYALEKAPALPATTLATWCYENMFADCSALKNAPELPATTLTNGCYYGMFNGCTSLTAAPALPATKLATACYSSMFNGCTSLKAAPALPATKLANSCYRNMFYNCSSIKTAPKLPATEIPDQAYGWMFSYSGITEAPQLPAKKLSDNCYSAMFEGTPITKGPKLPATTLATSCYYAMFWNCSELTEAPELPATTLAAGCYESMFNRCTKLEKAPDLNATTLPGGCYNQMFNCCFKLSSVKCLATEMTDNYAIYRMLNYAGIDESVTKRTFTRSTENNNWVNNDEGAEYVNQWYVPTIWTIDPAITAASAPARRASASVKNAPVMTRTPVITIGHSHGEGESPNTPAHIQF